MKNLKAKIFRRAGEISFRKADGSEISGHGVIYRNSDCTDWQLSMKFCTEFGEKSVPLYTYMGDTNIDNGDVIITDSGEFSVISAEVIEAFGISFCVKGIIERIL